MEAPENLIPRARVPAVDAHTHLGRWLTGAKWAAHDIPELLDLMDTCNIGTMINFDGRWGAELEANLERYDRAYPGRFATFCQVDWKLLDKPNGGDLLAYSLESSVIAGARGLKVWKDLGLRIRNSAGQLVFPDDKRLEPLWGKAAELAVPVAIHTADPVAFFDPVDEHNERLEELLRHPELSLFGTRSPTFHQLIDALEKVVAENPEAIFIGLHMGCYAENIEWVGRALHHYPNFYVDIAARIAELGRKPGATRALILRHPERVLFGTDGIPPDRRTYGIYFRFLESRDEYFSYSVKDPPVNGRWRISALQLPDEILRKVYALNFRKLVPGLAPGSE